MKVGDYIVVLFKNNDYVATKETNLKNLKEWYEREYEEELTLDEIKILTDTERNAKFNFSIDDYKKTKRTSYNQVLKKCIKEFGPDNYIYLVSINY